MNPGRDQILGFLGEVNKEFEGGGEYMLQQLKAESFVDSVSLIVNQAYLQAWKQTVDDVVSQISQKWFGEEIHLEEDLRKWYQSPRASLFKEDEQFIFLIKDINSKAQNWKTTIKTALMRDQTIFTIPETGGNEPGGETKE